MVSEIVEAISGKSVLVDACVSRDIAEQLKAHGVNVRHIGDINSHLKDEEIAQLMAPDEILITRDYGFFKVLGPAKAILLMPHGDSIRTYPKLTKAEKRLLNRRRLSAELRYAVRELIAKESKSGELQRKILWGIFWMLGYIKPQSTTS